MNCYILVGGRSERMGQSKVALFLPRVAAAARAVFPRVMAVDRAGTSPAGIETIFEDEHEMQAPAFGVARALRHAAASCFVLAVDYPLITPAVLQFVEQRFSASQLPVVAPRWNGKVQMLCAAYAPSVRQILEQRLASGRYDLRGLAGDDGILDEDDLRNRFAGEPLMNVNTPADWERAKALS